LVHEVFGWRVEIADAFYDSLADLDPDPETITAYIWLLRKVVKDPRFSQALADAEVRALKIRGGPGLAPLRCFYSLEGKTLTLVGVEYYDE